MQPRTGHIGKTRVRSWLWVFDVFRTFVFWTHGGFIVSLDLYYCCIRLLLYCCNTWWVGGSLPGRHFCTTYCCMLQVGGLIGSLPFACCCRVGVSAVVLIRTAVVAVLL